MSHTNSTTNYGLPQFLGTDKPSWLGDVNTAYADIDTQMKANADAASDAYTAATAAAGAVDDLTPRVSTAEDDIDALEGGISDLGAEIRELGNDLMKYAFIAAGDEFGVWGAPGWLSGDKKTARFYIDLPKPSHNKLTLPTFSIDTLTILIAASDGHIDGNTSKDYKNEPGYTLNVSSATDSQAIITIVKDTPFNATYGNCPIFAHGTLKVTTLTAS